MIFLSPQYKVFCKNRLTLFEIHISLVGFWKKTATVAPILRSMKELACNGSLKFKILATDSRTRGIVYIKMFTRKLIISNLTPITRQYSSLKEVKVMKKIMAGRDKGKRRWHYEEFPKMVTASKLSNAEGQGKEANRRITVLNKLFMKNVTDLMATGVFAEVLFGYGIQISTVKVSPDFKKLNIFWFSDKICDDEVNRRLKSIAGPLRHELSVLRLMGEIPQINFCFHK